MKFAYSSFDEDMPMEKKPNKIFRSNQFDWTEEQFNEESMRLFNAKVNHKDIDGYVMELYGETAYCKYDKNNQLFICYKINKDGTPDFQMRTKRSWGKYQGTKYIDYSDEMPSDM